MSTEALSCVLQYSESRLAARLVLVSIANHANPQGVSWPGLKTISREAGGVSLRQIKRCLRFLVEISEISIDRCASPLGTNLYVILLLHKVSTVEGTVDRMSLPWTGCVINQRREKEAPAQPCGKVIEPVRIDPWLQGQIAQLAKQKAM